MKLIMNAPLLKKHMRRPHLIDQIILSGIKKSEIKKI